MHLIAESVADQNVSILNVMGEENVACFETKCSKVVFVFLPAVVVAKFAM